MRRHLRGAGSGACRRERKPVAGTPRSGPSALRPAAHAAPGSLARGVVKGLKGGAWLLCLPRRRKPPVTAGRRVARSNRIRGDKDVAAGASRAPHFRTTRYGTRRAPATPRTFARGRTEGRIMPRAGAVARTRAYALMPTTLSSRVCAASLSRCGARDDNQVPRTRARKGGRAPVRPLQLFRSPTKRAAARRTPAPAPNGASSAIAPATVSASRARAPSTPRRATRVALPRAASFRVALPAAAAEPVASIRSSASWKARPSFSP